MIIPDGVLCFTLDRIFDGSMEYFIGDGVHKYSELTKYAGVTEAYTGNNISLMTDSNGLIDRSVVPHATATQYGTVKASVAGGAGQAILGDANGKYNFGDDATLDPSCLNPGVIPVGVTIPASQVTGDISGNAAYAASAGTANYATSAGSAGTAATATNAAHAAAADNATSANTATTATTAGKLVAAKRITVSGSLDGSDFSGYADFDGSTPITIALGALTSSGSGGSSDLSGYMPLLKTSSGVGQMLAIGSGTVSGWDDNNIMYSDAVPTGTWIVFGKIYTDNQGEQGSDTRSNFVQVITKDGNVSIALAVYRAITGNSSVATTSHAISGFMIRIA